MSDYTPDCWKIVEIDTSEHGKIYKVLGSWYGGFAGSNHWKLSSGIEDVKLDDGTYVLPQASGSVYFCHEGCERISGLIGMMYASIVEKLEGIATVRMLDMKEFLETR